MHREEGSSRMWQLLGTNGYACGYRADTHTTEGFPCHGTLTSGSTRLTDVQKLLFLHQVRKDE